MSSMSEEVAGSLWYERISLYTIRVKAFCAVYRTSRIGMFGLILIFFFIIIALAAPWIAPYDPRAMVDAPLMKPSDKNILGTDQAGRDIYSQMIWGSRLSLIVGILASFFCVMIGTVIGLLSGFYGGVLDMVLMRITDLFISLPYFPFVLILAALLGRSIWNIVFVIAIAGWTGVARMVRSQVMSVKEKTFIEAAKSIGGKDHQIIIRHILPNVVPIVFANAILGIVDAILAEAGLAFLGLGDPTLSSWGMVLHNAHVVGATVTGRWWIILPPGLMLMLLTLGFALSSYSLDHVLNPRLRKRR